MTIYLFYKTLAVPGGAERLLIEEYKTFKSLGYNVKIVVFKYDIKALFGEDIEGDIINLNSKIWFVSMFKFIFFLKGKNPSATIVSSGIIEVYLVSLVLNIKYSIHMHHPISMNRDTAKYSYFLRNKYNYILKRSKEVELLESQKKRINNLFYVYISLRQLLISFAIKSSMHVFVLSKYAKEELKYIYNVNSCIIQGAIQKVNPRVNPISSIIKNSGLKILSVSRLEPQKRIKQAIYAFSEILRKYPSSIMYIGGLGIQENYLKSLVQNLKINDKVVFLGFISNEKLLDYYTSADIFLSLDWADYNITVYEAISARVKVIVSNEGEFDDRLTKGGYIFNVDPNNIKNISDTIINAYRSKKILSEEDLCNILNSYTWTDYCKSIAHILNIKPQ